MKILILANDDVGLYQFRRELIEELLKKKNKVVMSLPYGDMVVPLKEMGCKFIDTEVDRRGLNPFRDLKLLIKYFQMLRFVKPDLVITYTIKPNIYGGFACAIKKVPCAINITGLGTAFQKKGILRTFVSSLYKLACRKAKVVFFENEGNRQLFIREHIVQEEQTCLLHGAGVNLQHFQPADYPMDSDASDKTRFLFVGRVMKEKGIEELFTAMRRLVSDGYPVELDVLGGYEEDYESTIKTYESQGWLHYHGYQKDVRPFIADCHCFVLPSWHEGMANTNLECAASARPIITSDIYGCKEAVIDGISGYTVKKQDADDLYQKMRDFLELSPQARKEMGLEGRRHMEREFDKREVVKKTMEGLDLL